MDMEYWWKGNNREKSIYSDRSVLLLLCDRHVESAADRITVDRNCIVLYPVLGDGLKEDERGEACGTHGRERTCIQSCGWET